MVNLLENDEEDILSQPNNEGPGDTLTPKPENDFAARLEAMVQQLDQQATDLNKFRTKQSVSFAGEVPNPDDHAVDVENADKTNLPVEVAQAQRPAFDAAALDAQVEKMNPGYLKWLGDRDNAAISKDDTSALERIGLLWDATKGAYKTGNAITDVGTLGAVATATEAIRVWGQYRTGTAVGSERVRPVVSRKPADVNQYSSRQS